MKKRKLSTAALNRLLKGIEILNFDAESFPFVERGTKAAEFIFDLDFACLDAFDRNNVLIERMGENPSNWKSETEEIAVKYLYEHPLFEPIMLRRQTAPLSLVECSDARHFYKTTLFNEVYRLAGVNDQIIFGSDTSENYFLICWMARAKRSFSLEELQAAALFQQHLLQASKTSLALKKIKDQTTNEKTLSKPQSIGKIVVSADGKIEAVSPTAFSIINKYFSINGRRGFVLPQKIETWRRHFIRARQGNDFYSPAESLIAENEFGRLKISLSFDDLANRQILVFEEQLNSVKFFEVLRLTEREAQILHFVSYGKTDAEIAAICQISTRTVQNHLQNIYQKLGVENRTAAVSHFFHSK